jgi:phasin family protein
MFSGSDPYASASTAYVVSQIAAFGAAAAIANRGAEQILALNIAAAKASAEDSMTAAGDLLFARDPNAFYWRVCALARSRAEKFVAYSARVTDVAAGTKEEFARLSDQLSADSQGRLTAFANSFSRSAPPVKTR